MHTLFGYAQVAQAQVGEHIEQDVVGHLFNGRGASPHADAAAVALAVRCLGVQRLLFLLVL